MFKLKDKQSTVVAGLSVTSGTLRMPGAHGQFVYRVMRKEQVIAEEAAPVMLKRFKDTVHEV